MPAHNLSNKDYFGGQLTSDVHGSARWMNAEEAANLRLDDPNGVVLGQKQNGDLLYFGGDGHLAVFAPTGAGKGIGFVQPNLVKYPGSMVVLDPKGENTIVGAEHRRKMGQKVIVLDPFGMSDQKSDTYNPLGALTFADGANVGPWIECLADALIPSQSEKDKHWTDGAKKFVVFLMWWMVAHEPPEKRNLVRFYELASGGRDLIYKIATVMSEGRSPEPNIARECKAKGNWYLDREERELSYFESVGSNYFGWIGDFVWADVLGGAPSPPLPLKTLAGGMTVFLVLPFHRMERYQAWLRLMVADLLSSLYETQGAPKTPVLFMLDEAFAGLGRMPTLTKAQASVRSAGARLVFVYQNIGQVIELYGDTGFETLVANSGVSLFWSVNDLKAQQFLSAVCGQKTTPVHGNPAGMAEPLLRVEAVRQLPADEIIALFRNSFPAKFGRLNVRTDARLSGLAPNKTYGAPVEKNYTARTEYVPVDLGSVVSKKRREDPGYEYETAPIATSRRRELADISSSTGIPITQLEALEAQTGKLLLRGNELGYLNEKGTFEALLSPGD